VPPILLNDNAALTRTSGSGSASACRIAGSAALYRALSPGQNYWGTVLALEHKAVDVGAKGWDALTGYGFDPTPPPPHPR